MSATLIYLIALRQSSLVTGPRYACLLLPALNVHAHHEEPQAQRYFCDPCSHEVREDTGL